MNGWCFSGMGSGDYFNKDSAITLPTKTPYFADCVWEDGWPRETDPPARDLYTGGAAYSIQHFTVARHGGKDAAAAPRNVPAGRPLVGRINIGFADAHVEAVKLENLWTLSWHSGWVTPAKRPP